MEILREVQNTPESRGYVVDEVQRTDNPHSLSPSFADASAIDTTNLTIGVLNDHVPDTSNNVQTQQDELNNVENPVASTPTRIETDTSAPFLAQTSLYPVEQTSNRLVPLESSQANNFRPLDPLQRVRSYPGNTTPIYRQFPAQDQASLDGNLLSPHSTAPQGIWPNQFEEQDVLQWIDVFFDRLHGTLPVVDKSLYRDFMLQRHHRDRDFAALILALCSLAIVGPIYQKERISTPTRTTVAKEMLASAAHLRTSYDFGEQADLEATTVTSFFMVAYYSLKFMSAID